MLPVATPPNAIVFGTRRLTVFQMAKTGLLLNLIGIATFELYYSIHVHALDTALVM